MSIFVNIASYCDPVLGFTIERALATARRPYELHFAIIDQQSGAPLAVPRSNHEYLRIPHLAARGPCWARAIAMTFYRGEDWLLLIDSHTDFDEGWDERLIEQARALGPRAVLSTYPNAFTFEGGQPVKKPITSKVLACTLMRDCTFQAGHPVLKFQSHPVETDEPVPAIHLGGCFLFAPGQVVLEVPYDPSLYFHGEEQSLFLRLYTRGWDVFHPPGVPIYHLYNTADAGVARPMNWDPAQDAARQVKWHERERASQQRVADLVAGKALGAYGLGSVRTLADYAAFSGIDYERRTIEPRAYLPLIPANAMQYTA
jgi:hypothetical protein